MFVYIPPVTRIVMSQQTQTLGSMTMLSKMGNDGGNSWPSVPGKEKTSEAFYAECSFFFSTI